jgi:hypothetical protein
VTAPLPPGISIANVTITGPVNLFDPAAIINPILDRLAALEHTMTQAFADVESALAALDTQTDALITAEAADRAAFDSLSNVVLAFIANLPAPGEVLTPEHAAQAQAIVDKLTAAQATQTQEAADEAALQADVPPTA